jgi:hypothetical protein
MNFVPVVFLSTTVKSVKHWYSTKEQKIIIHRITVAGALYDIKSLFPNEQLILLKVAILTTLQRTKSSWNDFKKSVFNKNDRTNCTIWRLNVYTGKRDVLTFLNQTNFVWTRFTFDIILHRMICAWETLIVQCWR